MSTQTVLSLVFYGMHMQVWHRIEIYYFSFKCDGNQIKKGFASYCNLIVNISVNTHCAHASWVFFIFPKPLSVTNFPQTPIQNMVYSHSLTGNCFWIYLRAKLHKRAIWDLSQTNSEWNWPVTRDFSGKAPVALENKICQHNRISTCSFSFSLPNLS